MNHLKKGLEEKLKDKKEEREALFQDMFTVHKEIEDLTIEIEFLDNYVKYTDNEERNRMMGTSPFERRKTRRDTDFNFAMISMVQKAARKREEDSIRKKSEIKQKMEIKNNLKNAISVIDQEISKVREELKKVKDELLSHYHSLLKKGRDTRQEGLVWIIKEIILLGSNVILSCLPNFLDESCISYLFNVQYLFYFSMQE